MCLILFAYRMQNSTPLIIAANRDEFYTRPTKAAHYWDNFPDLLAGKDLEAGGTWLGVTKTGRFAAVTNLASVVRSAPISRGGLALNFLNSRQDSADYAESLKKDHYQGFNLLLFDGSSLVYISNGREEKIQKLTPGYYGLSNANLDSNWPKVHQGKRGLKHLVQSGHMEGSIPARERHTHLVQLLQAELSTPDMGLKDAGEYRAASSFIRGEEYGTRASTGVFIGDTSISFYEQNYIAGGNRSDDGLFEFPYVNSG